VIDGGKGALAGGLDKSQHLVEVAADYGGGRHRSLAAVAAFSFARGLGHWRNVKQAIGRAVAILENGRLLK